MFCSKHFHEESVHNVIRRDYRGHASSQYNKLLGMYSIASFRLYPNVATVQIHILNNPYGLNFVYFTSFILQYLTPDRMLHCGFNIALIKHNFALICIYLLS